MASIPEPVLLRLVAQKLAAYRAYMDYLSTNSRVQRYKLSYVPFCIERARPRRMIAPMLKWPLTSDIAACPATPTRRAVCAPPAYRVRPGLPPHRYLIDMKGAGVSGLLGERKALMQKIFGIGSDYFPESVRPSLPSVIYWHISPLSDSPPK